MWVGARAAGTLVQFSLDSGFIVQVRKALALDARGFRFDSGLIRFGVGDPRELNPTSLAIGKLVYRRKSAKLPCSRKSLDKVTCIGCSLPVNNFG